MAKDLNAAKNAVTRPTEKLRVMALEMFNREKNTMLTELTERLEKAKSGGRDLDALIEIEHRRFQAYEVGLTDKQRAHWRPVGNKGEVEEGGTRYHPPLYSFNIDDALRLVPDGWQAILYTENGTAELYATNMKKRAGIRERAQSSTLALAICAVSLRARATLSNTDH